jgi:hypothetical protein
MASLVAVIGSCHQVFRIEKSFRMAKATCGPVGLAPRPRLVDADLTIGVRGAGGQPLDRSHNRLVDP